MIRRFLAAAALDRVETTQKGPVPDLDRCFNRKQKRHVCTACQDRCPQKAITFHKELKINPSRCLGCYACSGACPTHSLTPQGAFIKTLSGESGQALTISCRRGSAVSGLQVPCLSSLPWEFYAYASYGRPVTLVAADCETCRLGREGHLENIHRSLARFWKDCYPEKISTRPALPSVEYSRRELFRGAAKKLAADSHVSLPQEELPQHPSIYRNLLMGVLDPDQRHGWLGLKKSEGCISCGICEKLCPCQAISHDGSHFSHDPRRCLGCGLCQKICPKQCLSEEIIDPVAENLQEKAP